LLIPIFGWIGTAKAAQLERWQEPLLDNDRSAGDFSLRLELLCDSLQDEAASRSPCTVTSVSADDRRGLSLFDIQTALDELATYCPFSNIPASTRSSLAVRRTQTEILTVLFTGGRSPKECRWLCRILLKDMKLALECSRLLNAIDYRLGEVYKV
jgi:hypothetical protein